MKRVIITGGSSGIGAATAYLLSNNFEVVILDKHEPESEYKFIQVNVTNGDSIKEAFSKLTNVDAVIHAAGIYIPEKLTDMSDEAIKKQIETNFTGTALLNKYALKQLSKGGVLVNISSALAEATDPGSPIYGATKAAINMLTKSLAQQYASQGIRINSVLPGPIDTPMLRDAFSNHEEYNEYIKLNPMKRVGTPQEVAKLIQFLISEDASYITGACIPIDGGEASASVYS